MPYDPPPDLATLTLEEIAALAAARRLPRVDQWQPAQRSDSLMRITGDGRWFHDGGEIRRPAMVRAFASLLMRDDRGRYWLVTPAEKLSIEVEDAAFIATDMTAKDGALAFRLNTDDLVIAGPGNPLRAAGDPDVPAIYLAVRHGCEARLNRSTYAQLADLALSLGDDWTVESQGARFSLVPQ